MDGQRVKIIVYNNENQVEKELETKQGAFVAKDGEKGMQGGVVFQGGGMDMALIYFELQRVMKKLEAAHPNIKRDSVLASVLHGLTENVEKEVHEVFPVDDTGVAE